MLEIHFSDIIYLSDFAKGKKFMLQHAKTASRRKQVRKISNFESTCHTWTFTQLILFLRFAFVVRVFLVNELQP